ncbi:MAG TPA: hypothetical protein VFC76_00375 [Oscillospiraceae bacterium]|nr:hypothetical protein [Oscillospiraceae bacterium]
MCDTLIAVPPATADGYIIFGKNSDREPNEPLILQRFSKGTRKTGTKQKCTYIEVETKEQIHEVLLMKPSWIWGAEMGFNSKGVVIGNEAVFTKEKQLKEPALLGMDRLRLALECCDTAEKAADYIIDLLLRYGQGGKAGYTENLRYHNSFIISDRKEAFVLETAGKHWALKKIDDYYSISNALTLEDNYDKSSLSGGVPFKKRFDDKLFSYGSKGNLRQQFSMAHLSENNGNITTATVLDILRSHCGNKKTKGFTGGSMYSICMHAGGIISSQTTGSMILRSKGNDSTAFISNTSLPCVSLFMPYWLIDDNSMFYGEYEHEKAVSSWKRSERVRRGLLGGGTPFLDEYLLKRDDLEAKLFNMAEFAATDDDKLSVMKFAKQKSQELECELERLVNASDTKRPKGLYYSYYWKKQNKQL